MVIVKIFGGLGNQLFQYAFGKAVEEKYGYQVKYDLSYYEDIPKSDSVRKVFVSRYIPSHKLATREEISRITEHDKRVWKKVLKRLGFAEYRTKYERPGDGITSIEQVKDNTLLIGYWQSEEFFTNVCDKIREEFSFENEVQSPEMKALTEKIKSSDSVSIHVRGGDYLLSQNQAIFGGICTSEYYEEAYAYMKKKNPSSKFFLFTNDVEWTKKNIHLPYGEITMVSKEYEATEDWMDLYLMSICKDNIIANSSYSWWAAWLNAHADKTVVCPYKWTNDNQHADILGKSWIKMGKKG